MFNPIKGAAIGGLAILASLAVFADSDVAADNAARFHAYQAVAFSTAKSVTVAQLDGSHRLGFGRLFAHAFHGFRLISEWKKLDAKEAEKISMVLRERIESGVRAYSPSAGDNTIIELSTFCIPKPGFAVKIETKRGAREFLICLECGDVVAFGEGVKGVEFSLASEITAELKDVYQGAFPK
jgi:hypothetical protein